MRLFGRDAFATCLNTGLTPQVEALCSMAAGADALLGRAEAVTAELQAAYAASAFAGHDHVDSPAVLIRNAIRC